MQFSLISHDQPGQPQSHVKVHVLVGSERVITARLKGVEVVVSSVVVKSSEVAVLGATVGPLLGTADGFERDDTCEDEWLALSVLDGGSGDDVVVLWEEVISAQVELMVDMRCTHAAES